MREYRNLILCGILYTAFAGLMVACFYVGCLISVATNWLPTTYGSGAPPPHEKNLSKSLSISNFRQKKSREWLFGYFSSARHAKNFTFLPLTINALRIKS
jgi:hypothetical protein